MSGSVNKCILVGNLTADPEIRRTKDGKPIANLRLATNESWKDRTTGERKERAEYHTVVVFSEGLCKVLENYARKGSKLYVEGQLQTRKWEDRDGNDRYSTEIILRGFGDTIQLLDSRKESEPERREPAYEPSGTYGPDTGPLDDSEIPF